MYSRFSVIKNLNEHSDSELILLWQSGDEGAFELIYNKYAYPLLAITLQKTGNREASKEIVQDAFVSLFKNKTSLNEVSSVMAYLYIIVKNRILDLYRHSLIHEKYIEYATHNFNETTNSTIDWIETRELEQRLNTEIEKLPAQCRNVFKLSRRQFLSNKEIAAHLEISENTVEQHMRKALRILRTTLSHYGKIVVLLLLNG